VSNGLSHSLSRSDSAQRRKKYGSTPISKPPFCRSSLQRNPQRLDS
jgi:hypothetical protein